MSKKTQFLILLFFGISFHSHAQDFISISNSESSKVFSLIKEDLTEEIIGKTAVCTKDDIQNNTRPFTEFDFINSKLYFLYCNQIYMINWKLKKIESLDLPKSVDSSKVERLDLTAHQILLKASPILLEYQEGVNAIKTNKYLGKPFKRFKVPTKISNPLQIVNYYVYDLNKKNWTELESEIMPEGYSGNSAQSQVEAEILKQNYSNLIETNNTQTNPCQEGLDFCRMGKTFNFGEGFQINFIKLINDYIIVGLKEDGEGTYIVSNNVYYCKNRQCKEPQKLIEQYKGDFKINTIKDKIYLADSEKIKILKLIAIQR
jgi:hypothetical protein